MKRSLIFILLILVSLIIISGCQSYAIPESGGSMSSDVCREEHGRIVEVRGDRVTCEEGQRSLGWVTDAKYPSVCCVTPVCWKLNPSDCEARDDCGVYNDSSKSEFCFSLGVVPEFSSCEKLSPEQCKERDDCNVIYGGGPECWGGVCTMVEPSPIGCEDNPSVTRELDPDFFYYEQYDQDYSFPSEGYEFPLSNSSKCNLINEAISLTPYDWNCDCDLFESYDVEAYLDEGKKVYSVYECGIGCVGFEVDEENKIITAVSTCTTD